MSIFFYIIGYIVLSIAIAYYLKSRKNKVNEINKYSKAKQIKNKIFDRRKHNDYMNNPKFSYMSCNKYNPESKFYKGEKAHNQRVLKRFVLIDELEFERITNHNKVGRDIVIEQIKRWNISDDYDTHIELITDEKEIDIIKFFYKDDYANEDTKIYRLENAIEEITQIIARL